MFGERIAAELLRNDGIAGTQKNKCALEGGARQLDSGDGGFLAAGPATIIAAAFRAFEKGKRLRQTSGRAGRLRECRDEGGDRLRSDRLRHVMVEARSEGALAIL